MIEVNKIYNENCLDTMSRMSDEFVDLTVTSPPYDNLRDYKGFTFPFSNIANELYRITKTGGILVWVVGDATIDGSESGTSFKQALYFMNCGFNLHDTMIYKKNSYPFPPSNRYFPVFEYMFVFSKGRPKTTNLLKTKTIKKVIKNQSSKCRQKDGTMENIKYQTGFDERIKDNIWVYEVGNGKSTMDKITFEHPATFPEKLAADHIYSWSNEGDLVYDPFSGSGTTCKMAHLQKRNWIGSEISQEYTKISEMRIAQHLAQTMLF